MNTTIRTIIYAAAVVLATVSCQKSAEPVQPAEEGKETIDICVSGLMGEYTQVDGTKAELVNTVRVSWKGGETVYVFDGVKRLGSLKASLEGDEDRYALLSTDTAHTVKAPATGTTKLTLVYSPLLTETPTVNAGEISVSLASQNGEKAPFVAYATLDYTGTNITNAVVPFQFATSVIKVNCTGLKPGTAITSATLSNVNTACKLTLSGDKVPVVAGGTNGTITRTGDSYFASGKINAEGEAVFQIAVPALEEASQARVMTVAQGSDKVEDKKFTKKALSAATSVNTVCQLVNVLPAGALPGVFTVADDGGKTIKQIYFSQGNLWYGKVGDAQTATFNFEANQYDFQSSWSTSHVSHFYWSKDERVAYSEDYNNANTTYGITPDQNDVFFTNETVTTAKAGFTVNVNGKNQSGWRTLSTKEWQYLFNTRTFNNGANIGEGNSYQRATINSDATSVHGVILYPDNYTLQTGATSYTSKEWTTMEENGCVFLPAAGRRDGFDVNFVGDFGCYWSSTANDEDYAYGVDFDSYFVHPVHPVNYGFRSSGYSVRLITEVK